jgi:2-polyprenyl-6-methoxyphenol hydroxylase-like FAD-dependent oxidoreductase
LPLNRSRLDYLPEHLRTRLTSIVPPTGTYMIVTQSIKKRTGQNSIDAPSDHIIWVFISSRCLYENVDPKLMDGESVKRLTLRMMEGWHPLLRRMVTESDSKGVSAIPILSSIPIEPWKSTNVTLLGDAIHTMTPLQGLGGSTALRDARLLRSKFVEVDRGTMTLVAAIHEYEMAMIAYGFKAVRISARFGEFVVSNNRLLRAAFKAALRVSTMIPLLNRRMFRPNF